MLQCFARGWLLLPVLASFLVGILPVNVLGTCVVLLLPMWRLMLLLLQLPSGVLLLLFAVLLLLPMWRLMLLHFAMLPRLGLLLPSSFLLYLHVC